MSITSEATASEGHNVRAQALHASEAGRSKFRNEGLLWVLALLCFALIAGVLTHRHLPAGIDLSEYGAPSLEFAHTHHLGSVYLAPGLPVVEGLAMDLFHGEAGLAVANIGIYLVWVGLLWVLLRQLGVGARQAFGAGLLFALYPDILLGINRIYQTNLSAVCLLAGVAALIHVVHRRTSYRADAVLTGAIGLAMLCRSNLVVLLPVTWIVLWRFKLPKALPRAVVQAVAVAAIYVAGTLVVHGRVFWPQVGTYCLFSGANEFTEMDMQHDYNNTAEGSLIPALQARGYVAYHEWGQAVPSENEIRNPRFMPIYWHEAIKFAVHHPVTMAKLTWLKFINLVRPDLRVHPAGSVGGFVKILAALVLPAWIAVFIVLREGRRDPAGWIIALVVFFYLVPYLITVTAPKFRIPIDALCLMHIVAMLLVRHNSRKSTHSIVDTSSLPAVAAV